MVTTIDSNTCSGDMPASLTAWCTSQLGAFALLATDSHVLSESQAWRIEAHGQSYYVKYQRRKTARWHAEVHAYERWTPKLQPYAPRLVAARSDTPCAVLVTALQGRSMQKVELSPGQEQAAWNAAGRSLARLHALAPGSFFGPCLRDGCSAEAPERDPVLFMRRTLERLIRRGIDAGALDEDEVALGRQAAQRVDVFVGEVPVASHRDYSPRNWLVSEASGKWRGMIDFDHSAWDVRTTDIGRWWDMRVADRPDLERAFFAGYGRSLTERLKAQILIARIMNTLRRIVWAVSHGDTVFEAESRAGLQRLAAAIEANGWSRLVVA